MTDQQELEAADVALAVRESRIVVVKEGEERLGLPTDGFTQPRLVVVAVIVLLKVLSLLLLYSGSVVVGG